MMKNRILLALIFLAFPLGSQPMDLSRERGREVFREGVEAFHQGFFNRSITAFEAALGYSPEDSLFRYWLGNSLYYSGFVEAALGEWSNVLRTDDLYPYLESLKQKIETRRGVLDELNPEDRTLAFFENLGTRKGGDDLPLFLRPTSIRPLPSGGYLIAAFGSQNVMEFNANGNLVHNFLGGLWGFSGPYDVLPVENGYFVSEYTSGRIQWVNSLGLKLRSFGGRGREEGQFLGPGYMAIDEEGNLYITDYGNRRVQKFTQEGEFLLAFGSEVPGFSGIEDPTGLTFAEGKIWLADKKRALLLSFDTSGNYLGSFGSGILQSPEGISWDGRRILVADGQHVRSFDPILNDWTIEMSIGEGDSSVIFAARDENKNLLVSHFHHSLIRGYTTASRLISGLHVEVMRVYTQRYPTVFVDVQVEDWQGNPVVGLQGSNFILEESETRAVELEMDYRAYQDEKIRSTVIIQSGGGFNTRDLKDAFQTFSQNLGEPGFWDLFSTSLNPVALSIDSDTYLQRLEKAERVSQGPSRGGLDQSIRLASGNLVGTLQRPVIFYLTDGTVHNRDFGTYDGVKLASFLKANRILFVPILMGSGPVHRELEFLARESGGVIGRLKSPQGFQDVFRHISTRPLGRYILKYETITPPEFGLRYIPLTLEVNYFLKSGRGQLGFFAPLDTRARN